MRTEQEICIMGLVEARKVLLLYAIINIVAPFWKGRKKIMCLVFLYYPAAILCYIQTIYNLNGITMY